MDSTVLEYAKAIWLIYGHLDSHFENIDIHRNASVTDCAAYYCWCLLKRILDNMQNHTDTQEAQQPQG